MSSGKEIYRCYDEYGSITVLDDGNKRYLSFGDGDEQSCQLKSAPFQLQHDYTQAMLLVLLFKKPRSMVLLGVGGGTLVSALHHFIPDMKMHLVELRPKVLDIAYKYFHLPRDKRVTVSIEDASEFLELSDAPKADLLFSDLFGSEGLDLQQTQGWFIERCSQLLSDDGWLVLNCWQIHKGEQEMLAALQTYFEDVRGCSTAEGNWVILAGKKKGCSSDAQLKNRAKKWSSTVGYSLLPSLSRLKPLA
jgi:spermidine synthase